MPEEIKKKGKKENKKEKPTYNVLQCLRFAFSRVWKYSKIYYLIVFMSLIFSLLYQLAQFYFSPALLGVLEANGGLGKYLLTLLILGGGQAFLSGLSNYIDCNRTAPIMVIDSRIKEEITHKISNTSYPNFLTEKFKNRTGQAFEATGEIATSSEHVFYYFLQKIILFAIYLYFLNDIHPILGLITAACR